MTSSNDLWDAIERIERRIGVLGSSSPSDITGELSLLRSQVNPSPNVDIDLPISGDTFDAKYSPILNGDSHVINGHVLISVGENNDGDILVEEWRNVSFDGSTGTLIGAEGRYDKKKVTLSYFYNKSKSYGISVSDGFVESVEDGGVDVLYIVDDITGKRYSVKSDWSGSFIILEDYSGNEIYDTIQDSVTGQQWKFRIVNGTIEYR